MRLCRYCWVACLAFLIFFRGEAFAAAVPAYSGKMNQAVGGIIQQKVGKWGFAANDPRFGATLTGVGAGVTTLAAGIAGGAVASVGWPALLAAAGISALVTGAVSLATDGLYKWLFNSDGTVTTPATSTTIDLGQLQAYQGFWACQGNYAYIGASPLAACIAKWQAYTYGSGTYQNWGPPPTSCAVNGMYANCTSSDGTTWDAGQTRYYSSGSPVSCGSGQVAINNTCTTPNSAATGTTTPATTGTPAQQVAALPDSELAKPVSDEALAAAVNSTWKAMGSNVPNSLPWSAIDPVTPADVAEWRAANPGAVPTVSDMIAPVASPGASTVPISSPSTSTSPSTGPAPTTGSGTQVDLGPNPNVAAPGLEATPTAQQIMSPILNLMPDLKNFAVPSHTSSCATGSFSWNSHTYTIDAQCQLIEQNRTLIEAAMLLVWTIAAIFIVLRA